MYRFRVLYLHLKRLYVQPPSTAKEKIERKGRVKRKAQTPKRVNYKNWINLLFFLA